MTPDKVEQVLKGDSVDKCSLFALTLFNRWALRDMFIWLSSFELAINPMMKLSLVYLRLSTVHETTLQLAVTKITLDDILILGSDQWPNFRRRFRQETRCRSTRRSPSTVFRRTWWARIRILASPSPRTYPSR